MRAFFRLVNRFRKDRRGNIAVIFGIVLVPLLAFMGAAIDYSRAVRARASMQSALDSVVLMVAKDLTSNLITTSQISSKAQAYFAALYTDAETQSPNGGPVTITATYTVANASSGSTIQVSGTGAITTDFMQMFGFPKMAFNASSTSTWGANLLRVALVLDNTGSMAQYNKMTALQQAAPQLVTQLSGLAQKPGDVYISVIPFEVNVNVGSFNGVSNTNANWLRWDFWDPQNGYCSGGNLARAECLGHGYSWNHSNISTNHSLWNGCVSDRGDTLAPDPGNYDVLATAPTSLTTDFPANQDSRCPAAKVLPLTYNWTNVNNTIAAMSPGGTTNQTIGLLWGWLSLLQQSPMNAPAEDPNYKYQHIIILFTDGLNTMDRWYGNGSSDPSGQIDSRMKHLCDNFKATGGIIYAVQIDTDGAGVSPVLPYCASGSTNFFMLTQASQIQAAFQQIGTSISQLRVLH